MLKLLSLNIEGDNHLDPVVQLVRREDPDLICFHEVYEIDVAHFKHTFDMEGLFIASETILQKNSFRLPAKGKIGTLILSKAPVISSHVDYYFGSESDLPELTDANGNAANRFLFWVEVEKDGQVYIVVTTHFTVTKGGTASQEQRENMKQILKLLDDKEFIFCGDFNAPRGGEIFGMLASKYTDNIPVEVKTTLDSKLHRAGPSLPNLVVDGLFTSRAYRTTDVRVVCGVSDHCAIVAEIDQRVL